MLAIILAVGIVTALYFSKISIQSSQSPVSGAALRAPHIKDSDVSIKNIRIKVFYAVPKNKIADIYPGWKDKLAGLLADMSRFHSVQFRGSSDMRYDIFFEPVILRNDDIAYDTENTNAGNPQGLKNIGQEIESRVFKETGDLYNKNFAAFAPGEYRVMALLYEGVGGSGGLIYETGLTTASEIAKKFGIPESWIYIVDIKSVDGFFLVNRKIATASIFYHEFGHTIGIPDEFGDNDGPYTEDVMGEGRKKPIENTYIDRSFMKGMGIVN